MDNFNYLGVPAPFGMGLVLNERATQRYGSLTESEKEDIILRCKDAKSQEEVDSIIDALADDDAYSQLFQGPSAG